RRAALQRRAYLRRGRRRHRHRDTHRGGLRRRRSPPRGHRRHRGVRRVRATPEGIVHGPEPGVRAQEGYLTDTMRAIVLDARRAYQIWGKRWGFSGLVVR